MFVVGLILVAPCAAFVAFVGAWLFGSSHPLLIATAVAMATPVLVVGLRLLGAVRVSMATAYGAQNVADPR